MQALRSAVRSFLPGDLSSISLKSLSVESFPIVAPIAVTTTLTIIVSEVAQRIFSALKFEKKTSQAASLLAGAATIVALSPTLPIGLSSGFLFVAYKIYSMRQPSAALEALQTEANSKAARALQLERETTALTLRINDLINDKVAITQKNSKLEIDLKSAEETIAANKTLMTAIEQQREENLQKIKNEKDDLSKKIAELEAQISAKDREIATLAQQLEKGATVTSIQIQEIAQLKESIKKAQENEKSIALERDMANALILQLNSEKEAHVRKVSAYEERIVALEKEKERALQDLGSKKDLTIADLENRLREMQTAKEQLKENAEKRIRELNAQIRELNVQVNTNNLMFQKSLLDTVAAEQATRLL